MASEETAHAVLAVNVSHRSHNPKPGACILGELRIRGLEEDLDSVQGANDCFGLTCTTLV